MKNFNTVWALALFLGASSPAFSDANSTTIIPGPSSQEKAIDQDGVHFVLTNSTNSNGVATEEYNVKGESKDAWSQTLTFQRIELPNPVSVDVFVSGFKSRLEEGSAKVRLVGQTKSSAIFGVHYLASKDAIEQVVLVFVAKVDARRPNEIQVTQFAVNPSRMELPQMETQMKRWQSRFQAQANLLR